MPAFSRSPCPAVARTASERAFGPLLNDQPDRHGVGDVDEEGRYERQNDEGPRAGAVKFRHGRHIGDCRRRSSERDAREFRGDHRRLVVPAHHWKNGEHDIGDRRCSLDREHRAFLAAATVALLDYAERWMRAEIAAIPDGVYEFEDYLEDDGVDVGPAQHAGEGHRRR